MRSMTLIAMILFGAVVALGQTNKGGISGTVIDSNGGAVPGATVTITNIGTNQAQTVTTSDTGGFAVQSLDPVTYSVTVEVTGFKKAVLESVKVDTATTVTANVILEAGAVSELVSITADAPLINTESGTATHTVSERQLQDVPLSNRSVLDLAVTAPNVSGDTGSEDPDVTSGQPVPGYNLSVGGGRPGSTAILADGVNNTGVGIARAVVSFTPETVQEFTVQSSAYSAEYGTTGGGVINATTKSGTNSYSGVALWYTRNPKFNAVPFSISNAPRPKNNLRSNQVSFTIGGPIYLPRFGEGGPKLYNGKNKSFFFFAYEPRWRTDFVTASALVPNAAERSGNFNNLVRTTSGIVPASVATQFGLVSNGNANIYQQFVLQNSRLVPIVRQQIPGTGTSTTNPAVTYQYCQFGATGPGVTNVVVNGLATPQCDPRTYVPNPSLNIIPQAYVDPIGQKILALEPPADSFFLDGAFARNYFLQRSVQQNETRYTLRLDHNFTDNAKVNFRYTVTPAIGIRGAA